VQGLYVCLQIMSNYKFAIIGCGKIAERHAEEIKKHGQLVAVCDIVNEKADELSKKYLSEPYYNIDELLNYGKEVDIVSICTPNGLHASHSIKSLQAGKHVLCEKPMAITTNDAREMVKAEKQAGKRLFVVKQNRYNPPVIFVKKIIEENKLGRIFNFQMNCFWNRPTSYYQSSWKGTKELDGGILFTQFSHFIDLLYWLLGDVSKVKGERKNFLHKDCIEFEDTGVALLEMNNGGFGTINYTINSEKKNMEGSLTLFGEKGTVKIGGQYLNELEYFSVQGESHPTLPASKAANQYGFYEGSMSNHDKVYEQMIKAIDDPQHNFISSEETLKTIEIIEKIYSASPLLS
jgi:UDP-N-acetyl-2-amino-2-deoxyglucuronate dehydrogenase